MKNGYFITFEGGEGSGKTTQMEKVKSYLKNKKNYEVVIIREPGSTEISEKIRDILLDKKYHKVLNPKTELFLYLAARTQLYHEKIKPLLKDGKIILCDRFYDATLAYQGYARELGIEKTFKFNLWALDNFKPDITFLLLLDPEIGLKRESDKDRFNMEGLNFHEKVNQGYRIIADKFSERINKIIVGDKKPEIIFKRIKRILDKKL